MAFDVNFSNGLNSMLGVLSQPEPVNSYTGPGFNSSSILAGIQNLVGPQPLPLPSLAKEGIDAEVERQIEPFKQLIEQVPKPLKSAGPKSIGDALIQAIGNAVGVATSKDPGEALMEQLKAQRAVQEQARAEQARYQEQVFHSVAQVANARVSARKELQKEILAEQKDVQATNRAILSKDKDFERQVTLQNMRESFETKQQQTNQIFTSSLKTLEQKDKDQADTYKDAFTLTERLNIPPSKTLGIASRLKAGTATKEDDAILRKAQQEEYYQKLLLSGRELTPKEKEKNVLDFFRAAYVTQEKVPMRDEKGNFITDPLSGRPAERDKTVPEKFESALSAANIAATYYGIDITRMKAQVQATIDSARIKDEFGWAKQMADKLLKAGTSKADVAIHINSAPLDPTTKRALLDYLGTQGK